jgi:hypothetical protein
LFYYLKGSNGGALETQVSLEILSDFTNKTLEWQLADQQLSRFLVTTDFTKGDGSRTIPVTKKVLKKTHKKILGE